MTFGFTNDGNDSAGVFNFNSLASAKAKLINKLYIY